jgi:Protein of unknown function (DUF983)
MAMTETCPNCGLRFEREQGYWVGAITIDTGVTFGVFALLVIGMVAATWPDVPWTALLVTALVVNGVFPILFYPYARLLWVALDLRVRPIE